MNRTTLRALRTELLRGAAPVAAVAVVAAGIALLVAFPSEWAGRWAPLADSISAALLVLAPLATTVTAWQVGRDRRRRVIEQVRSTPRPEWQRVVVSWSAVTLGACAGLLVAWLAGAVLVAPAATYAGRAWGWTLVVAVAGLAAASAFGALAGRLVPWRLVAPLAGGVVAALLGRAVYVGFENSASGVPWLSPTPGWRDAVTYIGADLRLLQLLWLVALTVTLLAVATVRTWWRVAVPAAVAAVVAIPIVTGPGDDRLLVDQAAQELVCAPGDGPEVCFTRVNAFLLDQVAEPVREHLSQWDGVPDGYHRAVDDTSRYWNPGSHEPDGTAYLYLDRLITWTGSLTELNDYHQNIYSALADATISMGASYDQCEREDDRLGVAGSEQSWEQLWRAEQVAYQWAGAHPFANSRVSGSGPGTVPSRDPRADRLAALDEADRRAWLTRYLEVRETCDGTTLAELVEGLE